MRSRSRMPCSPQGFSVCRLHSGAELGAFRANFRSANATEDIVMTPSELRVRRVSHRGQLFEMSFNPMWVQLEQTGDPDFGIEHVYLVSRGRRLSVGRNLGPDEKFTLRHAVLRA